MPATKAARAIPSSSRSLKPSAPAPFPKSPSPICSPPSARTRPSPATRPCRTCSRYCRYSANPVGRLVLYTCGYTDEERFRLSDATCSALQLANFWQDVRVDFAKDRVYLPQDDMQRFGVTDATIQQGIATPEFRALLKYEVDYARDLFHQGLPLIGMVDRDLALDLDLFSRGGLEILNAIEHQDYDVLSVTASHLKAD